MKAALILITFGFFLCLSGLILEKGSETFREIWRRKHKAQPYLFSYCVHPNYLGYVIWRTSLLGLTQIYWLQFSTFLFLIVEFVFGDIAAQKERNIKKYGEDYKKYWDSTPKLIPFVY